MRGRTVPPRARGNARPQPAQTAREGFQRPAAVAAQPLSSAQLFGVAAQGGEELPDDPDHESRHARGSATPSVQQCIAARPAG